MLERDGRGLNLTEEVRDGILNHTGPGEPATLEGKIVRLVDRVAYINHDIDDALRAGILSPRRSAAGGDRAPRRARLAPDRPLVHDIVETSAEAGDIVQSEEIGHAMLDLRAFMFERVYLGPAAQEQRDTATATVRRIFAHLVEHPDDLPEDRPGDLSEQVTDYVAGMTDRFALAWH